jgi:F-box protein 11
LPVYYISTPELDDPQLRDTDELAGVLASRQFADWRELRYEPFTAPVVRKALDHVAGRLRDSFRRQPPTPPSRPGSPRPAATEAVGSEAEQAATVGPVAKTKPPTYVVDLFPGRGDFTTIGAAIQAAAPGDRILVRPGRYVEGLVVDKPLEILGDGPVQDIEVQARGAAALVFQANIGRVANLTLRQVGGEGEWFGVDITQGRLELEGCDISSQSLACVAIRNGADPRLRSNRIYDSKGGGVIVYDNGLGTLEDNDVFGSAFSGVEIKNGGNPTLRRNQIHGNKQAGVYVHTNGLGTLEDNDITDQPVGVKIMSGGNPTLRRNRINRNNYRAVWVDEGGRGVIEDNDLTGNEGGPWNIAKVSKANVKRSGNRE